MKRIAQQHYTDCGIACAATVAHTTYRTARTAAHKAFSWPRSQRSFYTTSAEMRTLLRHLGIQTGRARSVRLWTSISRVSIVAIKYRPKTGSWHWVVFDPRDECVLDPKSKRSKRRDLDCMKPRFCIPIVGRKRLSRRRIVGDVNDSDGCAVLHELLMSGKALSKT